VCRPSGLVRQISIKKFAPNYTIRCGGSQFCGQGVDRAFRERPADRQDYFARYRSRNSYLMIPSGAVVANSAGKVLTARPLSSLAKGLSVETIMVNSVEISVERFAPDDTIRCCGCQFRRQGINCTLRDCEELMHGWGVRG
jgi:hypothetical protein